MGRRLVIEDWPEPPAERYAELIEAFKKLQVNQSIVFVGSHSWVHQLATKYNISIKARAVDGKPLPRHGQVKMRIWRVK